GIRGSMSSPRPPDPGPAEATRRGLPQWGFAAGPLLLCLPGLPLLFQRLLSRLLLHALLRVLVLGRHVRDLLVGTSADLSCGRGRPIIIVICVAAPPDASSRFHLR